MGRSHRWDDGDDYEAPKRPCDGKATYRGEKQALDALRRVTSQPAQFCREVMPCRAYFCDHPVTGCFEGWHLTSQATTTYVYTEENA